MRHSVVAISAAGQHVAPQGAATELETERPLAIRVGQAWLFWILLATIAFWSAAAAMAFGASPAWFLGAPAALSPLFGALTAGLLSDRAFHG
jgi:hypothetical protein